MENTRQKTKNNAISVKLLSLILALSMVFALLPLTASADAYTTQGEGKADEADCLKVYMTSPAGIQYKPGKSTADYYYNQIGEISSAATLEFAILFGNAPGTQNMQAADLIAKEPFGIYSDKEGTTKIAGTSDFTVVITAHEYGNDWPGGAVGRAGKLAIVTYNDTAPELSLDTTYYFIIEDISWTGSQGTGSIGKKVVFEFTLSEDAALNDVTEVKLDVDKIVFEGKEQTYTLTSTVLPEAAEDKTVSYTSSDENVATVDEEGTVTAIAAGSATITVTTNSGAKTNTCAVVVNNAAQKRTLVHISGGVPLGEGNTYSFSTPALLADTENPHHYIVDATVEEGSVPQIAFQSSASGGKKSSKYYISVYRDNYEDAESEDVVETRTYTEATSFTYEPNQSLYEKGHVYYFVIASNSQSCTIVHGEDIVIEFAIPPIIKDATVTEGGNVDYQIDNEQFLDAVVSDEDQALIDEGAELEYEFVCEAVEDCDDADYIIEVLDGEDYEGIVYFNIEIQKYINGEEAGLVTELNAPISITIPIPEELQGKGYTFTIIRTHLVKVSDTSEEYETVVEELVATVSDDGRFITFVTDKFSTYALVYAEVPEEEAPTDTTKPATDTKKPAAEEKKTETIANTADNNMIEVAVFSVAAVSGLCGAAYVLRTRKDENV